MRRTTPGSPLFCAMRWCDRKKICIFARWREGGATEHVNKDRQALITKKNLNKLNSIKNTNVMKKIVKYGVLLMAAALTLSSCNCFKKMSKNQDLISVSTNPELLTLVGGEIVTDVTVVFPAKYFNPKAIVRVTPMLVFAGGAIEGTPKYFQGEKVKDNYTVISKTSGGVFTQRIAFPWDPRARQSTLQLKVEGKCGAGDYVLGGVITVAEGVNTLQQDLAYADAMTLLADDFKRVTHETGSVNIMYEVNRSNVHAGELSKAQTKLFEDFIRETATVLPSVTFRPVVTPRPKALKVSTTNCRAREAKADAPRSQNSSPVQT